ncbi:conserved hypothetical protein [Aeropyrum pernix K1]|uniref:CBS domain-containing protein n=1 Tax=Aeropyrum pernix (strain ATCC 700893 / DSM 11879 / JCM 9820 / NBRC 100138 / K1) TaxID=272557 RepID=Q9YFL5_AERPE|nr:CBS domain-containing protein [Aeropyrum pernix]BAA79146.1 conserved hypothetical protein [Aeropyrum pernix K1]
MSRRGGAPSRPPRPPIRYVATAPKPSRVVTRSRPEGVRWLRADGTPNWSQRVRRLPGDAKELASRPAVSVHKSAPILSAAEKIASHRVRGLVVIKGSGDAVLEGILLATDLVNYLGGGDYFQIVENRHRDSIYSALRKEVVATIMNRHPIAVSVSDDLDTILRIMVGEGIGFLPVLYDDGTLHGVITERNILGRIADIPFDKKVGDYMTATIVGVDPEAPLKEAMRSMVTYGFRRLLVISSSTGEIKGVITAKDIVAYFGEHEAFKNAPSGKVSEAISIPVYMVMSPEVYTIDEKASVADAARRMVELGVDSLIVVDGGEAKGIITERDVLVASVVEGER